MKADQPHKTIHQNIAIYIDWLATHSPKAAKAYPVWLNRLDVYLNKSLETITLDDINDFMSEVDFFALSQKKGFSSHSVRNCTMIFKAFFTYWHHRGNNVIDPQGIHLERPVHDKHRVLTEDEYNAVLAICDDQTLQDRQYKLLLQMLWETGARLSELVSLRIIDLDLENGCAYILGSVDECRRWLVWSLGTNIDLKRYLYDLEEVSDSKYVFASITKLGFVRSSHCSTRTIQRRVEALSRKAGLADMDKRPVVPHSFRSTVARDMEISGCDIRFIQEFLGYKQKGREGENAPSSLKTQTEYIRAARNRLE